MSKKNKGCLEIYGREFFRVIGKKGHQKRMENVEDQVALLTELGRKGQAAAPASERMREGGRFVKDRRRDQRMHIEDILSEAVFIDGEEDDI
jgi:hypothetical protein